MRQLYRFAMALTLATVPLLASIAHADPPRNPGRNLPPNRSGGARLTAPFTYYDADWMRLGPGELRYELLGLDPFNSTEIIAVELRQGGRTYRGTGIATGGKLVFTLAGFFFQCDAPGWGSYHRIGNPWSLNWVYLE